MKSAFGEDFEELKPDIEDELAFRLSQLAQAPEGIGRVIIADTGFTADEIKGRARLFSPGTKIPFNVVRHYEGIDYTEIKGKGSTVLVSVHVGENGWTTAIWESGGETGDIRVYLREDWGYGVHGRLIEVVENQVGVDERAEILFQKGFGGETDIAIVDGCEYTIVQIDPEGRVVAILNPKYPEEGERWIAATGADREAQTKFIEENGEKTLEEEVAEGWNKIPTESMGMLAPELSYNMEITPENGEIGYDMVLDAFARSRMLEKYWRDVGVKGELNADNLRKWLQDSYGPNGEAYWVPAVSPKGIPFMYLQGETGNGALRGEYHEGSQISQNGGFFLDKIGAIAFSSKDYQENPEISIYFVKLMEDNWPQTNHSPLIEGAWSGTPEKEPLETFGFLVDDNRFVFIAGQTLNDKTINPKYQRRSFFGGIEDEFDPGRDPKMMQAWLENYLQATQKWWQEARYWDYTNRALCITNIPGCDGYVNVSGIKETIFTPAGDQ